MSVQPSAQLADWNNVRQSLAQVCAGCDESEDFFSGIFDRLDGIAQELVRRQRAWALEHEQSAIELERQKAELAAELDMVRSRTAEMAERLVQQQSEFASERAHWTEELRRMRQVIETLAHQQAAQPAPSQAKALEPPADPVLSSVTAQFAMLQKDAAERRKKLAATN